MQKAISYMQLRGGSSKGLYFTSQDLPPESTDRDQVLLSAMGGADRRQIDGLGGADPLTSKAAIVGLSEREDADLDYLFLQVIVGEDRVDTSPNCGNILAGVVPFAIESGLITIQGKETSAVIHMVNSGNLCEVIVQTADDQVNYEGDVKIDGVPGTSAPIVCNYLETAGSATGALLPTGKIKDHINGIDVTCIDNGMPVVVIRAEDLGVSGSEPRDELNSNEGLKAQLEQIRLAAGPMMNLGDVANKVVPKMSLISAPQTGGSINTRTFIPHVCHAAVGVLGAVSVATACILDGSVASGIAITPSGDQKQMSIEHPTGEFSVSLDTEVIDDELIVKRSGILRTARLLSRGEVYVQV